MPPLLLPFWTLEIKCQTPPLLARHNGSAFASCLLNQWWSPSTHSTMSPVPPCTCHIGSQCQFAWVQCACWNTIRQGHNQLPPLSLFGSNILSPNSSGRTHLETLCILNAYSHPARVRASMYWKEHCAEHHQRTVADLEAAWLADKVPKSGHSQACQPLKIASKTTVCCPNPSIRLENFWRMG